MKLDIPIGIDDFKEIIEKDLLYVDKTHFIEDVINNSAEVQQILRPRRFGKSLNMSTLAYFFDQLEDNRHLFKGLYIESRPCFEQCGSHPVISISLKELKVRTYEIFLDHFRALIEGLYSQHEYLLEHLSDSQARFFNLFKDGLDATESQLMGALTRLMKLLEQFHKKRVILLIDEYDTPIHEAYNSGYYDEASSFMRSVLSSALKGNRSLEKAVLTGILRISKESIFSDLNHVDVYSVLNHHFAKRFGFTENEVAALLRKAGREEQAEDVQSWYNGYLIDEEVIYNPWSLLSFLKHKKLQAYWINTSSNDLIRKLLHEAGPGTQAILAQLMKGEVIQVVPDHTLAFRNLRGSALWSLLLYSGYLTQANKDFDPETQEVALHIPNREVLGMFQQIFVEFFQEGMGQLSMPDLLKALLDGDIDNFGKKLAQLIQAVFSYYDVAGATPERIYHAFVLGMLSHLHRDYVVRSNRESGLGRYDVMMIPKDKSKPGFIFEFKAADAVDGLPKALQAGLDQMVEMNYRAELEAQDVADIRELAVAFCGKELLVETLKR